jgi:hypothetical protein
MRLVPRHLVVFFVFLCESFLSEIPIKSLQTQRSCFKQGLGAYRAINANQLGYPFGAGIFFILAHPVYKM